MQKEHIEKRLNQPGLVSDVVSRHLLVGPETLVNTACAA